MSVKKGQHQAAFHKRWRRALSLSYSATGVFIQCRWKSNGMAEVHIVDQLKERRLVCSLQTSRNL